jgi:hypothetical protein
MRWGGCMAAMSQRSGMLRRVFQQPVKPVPFSNPIGRRAGSAPLIDWGRCIRRRDADGNC